LLLAEAVATIADPVNTTTALAMLSTLVWNFIATLLTAVHLARSKIVSRNLVKLL
jgi:hypothetical protein